MELSPLDTVTAVLASLTDVRDPLAVDVGYARVLSADRSPVGLVWARGEGVDALFSARTARTIAARIVASCCFPFALATRFREAADRADGLRLDA